MKRIVLTLTIILLMATQAMADLSGTCGDNAYWTLNEGTGVLTVSGSGKIMDFEWGDSPFHGNEDIKTIVISNGITSIGANTFMYCANLTSVTLPNTITTIGDLAFSDCYNLPSITLPSSLTTIGDWAFSFCVNLTSVTIPKSVKSIRCTAFAYCENINSLVVESGNTVYDSRNNCKAIIETKTNKLITGCRNSTIPSTVTTIGESAFEGCFKLSSITIPNSVKTIEDEAFYSCNALTSVTIPKSVTKIGGEVFFDCHSISSIKVEAGNPVYDSRNNCNAIIETKTNSLIVGCYNTTIPNGVLCIEEAAFSYCVNLTSITIPSSVKTIKNYAFEYCNGLTSISIPKSTTEIERDAFYNCYNFTSINVEAGNPVYDSRNNCNAIIETKTNKLIRGCDYSTIPNTVKAIGEYAFCGGTELTSVTIPQSVTSIESFAFGYCYELSNIYMMSPTPIEIAEDAFYEVNKEVCNLFVPNKPTSALSQYRNAEGWREFEHIYTFDTEGSRADVNRDGLVNGADVVSVYNYIISGTESGLSKSSADINADGNVNSADVVAIFNYIIIGE